MTARRRIGILGGTFDPPHRGHINVAVGAVEAGAADEVWMMVSPENPFKSGVKRSPARQRLLMCRMLVDDLAVGDIVKVSDFELSLPTPSYMINTLTGLRNNFPQYQFRLIIGADNLDDFDKWRESERILREYGLIVYPRDNELDASSDPAIITLTGLPRVDVSATMIRQLASRHDVSADNLASLTSDELARYILREGIYRDA
ncbi:MAG: nicotinate (nicotinamide) nucleotide adenylyltransferase [Muribaculaceae bacterium]|nr:nicotinate (nicotinamide) nucleotide adenylyltransferase [Muribaculaceae bacterium]